MKDGLLDRVTKIETTLNDIVKSLQAVARVVGTAEVQAELAAGQREEMEQQITGAVKEGRLHATGTVTPTSLVVGVENTAQGGTVFPGRFQLLLNSVPADSQGLFLGKKAGDEIPLANKNTIKILEVYDTAAPEVKAPKKSRKKAKPAPVPAVTEAN